ncbi:MLX-interacting protein-like isoform X2 [Sphaerodactylus townsendi]|uniref:MLX-interacting protein-like isoform X2 n=1 Tax=Sphaerodactylus townsendi TaxID=933632 RepID=UPI002027255B|nr:MLX-interacting protein-like isoform X2 [Sphaerodactylus townsendi]
MLQERRGLQAPRMVMMSRPQIIHSGHFMVSEPHIEPEPDPDPEGVLGPSGPVVPGLPEPGEKSSPGLVAAGESGGGTPKGCGTTYDFDMVNEGTCQIYRYGPRSTGALNIDSSLTKLFECMTLAYSGKIVSPKWKTFKGLKLLQRDKIRLNNAIWRAWYLQYVEKRQNPVCSFVTPLEFNDVDEHRKLEAVIMEGKYWKRQIGAVIREYHKWRTFIPKQRTFFHTRAQEKIDKPVYDPIQEVAADVSGVQQYNEMAGGCPMDLDPLHDLDALLDTIFSSRNLYGGSNLRGFGHQDNADMIQPTLTQLHPIFGEEFMDTLDPIPDFITSCRPHPTVQTQTLLTDATTALSQCDADVPHIATDLKELPVPGGSLMPIPISLNMEPPQPMNGQQTFLPLFPTSPVRISSPPTPQILHIQPQTTVVFSVIPHTGSEKPSSSSLSTSTGTFAVPTAASPAKGGRGRRLQWIAPAPSSSHKTVLPSTSLTCLLASGPTSLPLTPVMNSTQVRKLSSAIYTHNCFPYSYLAPFITIFYPLPQVCGTPDLPANVMLSSASGTERSPPVAGTASPDVGSKAKETENKGVHNPPEISRRCTAKRSRRSTFASSDYTRRMVISSGFDTLASLVLPGSDQRSTKLSKAVLLQKSVTYVGRLQQEHRQARATVERLRSEVEELSTAIDEFQRQLPPSGVPVLAPQSDQPSQLYEDYVRLRTSQDWRFWLFSVVIKPLFESYTRTVGTGSIKDFCQSVLSWLEQHCTLPILRPAISGSLLQLSKITSILTQPAQLPEQALRAISCPPLVPVIQPYAAPETSKNASSQNSNSGIPLSCKAEH